MNNNNLVIFNKEGYRVNTQIDQNNILYSSMFFDKNSTDTYKTQGLYIFENIEGSNATYENITLNKYQIFNTGGIYCYPSKNEEFDVLSITNTVNNSSFFTRWVEAKNIHNYVTIGTYLTITGLTITITPPIDNIFQVIDIKKDKVLLLFNGYDNTNTVTYLNAKINLLNVIEYNTLLNEPTYNMSPQFSEVKQRFSLISNDINAGTYTTSINPNVKTKRNYYIEYDDILVNAGITPNSNLDNLTAVINFYTDNLIISENTLIIDGTDNSIQINYVPFYLKSGDQITIIETSTTVNTSNTVLLTIDYIDRALNKIFITTATPLVTETVDAKLILATNKLELTTNIKLDNSNNLSNNLSLPITFGSFENEFSEELSNLNIVVNFDQQLNRLNITSELIGVLFDVEFKYIEAGTGTVTTIPVSFNDIDSYPIIIDEQLTEYSYIEPNSQLYKRQIEIQEIGSHLVININGKKYLEPFDTDIETTVDNWVSTYYTSSINSELRKLFIDVSSGTIISQGVPVVILTIESEFPNVEIFLDMPNIEIVNWYTMFEIQNIKNMFCVYINGLEFQVPFNSSDQQTIEDWIETYSDVLEERGVIVWYEINTVPVTPVTQLYFGTEIIDVNLNITFNIGYIQKYGDDSITEFPIYQDNSFDVIAGNKITGVGYDFTNMFSIGQTITLSENTDYLLMNTSYTIIEIEPTYITLSYQGPYQDTTLPYIRIAADNFIRKPKFGISTINNKAKLKWSWKETIVDEIFLYDFSGDQLKPYMQNFPDYNGIRPLCGVNGEIPLKLIKEPNKYLEHISNPQKQQTVFETIEHVLDWTDETSVDEILPNPLQVFIGYNNKLETWSKARLYLDFIEDLITTIDTTRVFDSITSTYTYDNVIKFENNNIINTTLNSFSFINLGYRVGQIINIKMDDITGDGQKLITNNNTDTYVIKEVYHKRIVVDKELNTNSSVQSVQKTTYPQFNQFGNPIMIERISNVTFTVLPKELMYIDFSGETEAEEERYNIHLNNKNKDILKLDDFFIFKDVDINEEGVDWIFMNRKRKELLENYGEIFNYISSYKSIINAINFFGYYDLTFNEYFQNIDPENPKCGQIFNLELLKILDKTTNKYEYNNLAFNNLRNSGYIKTNMFSLGYKVTDDDGNFVNAYSQKEVEIKLLGLKRWLHEHIVPLGAKILDINAQYKLKQNFKLMHETHMNKNYRVEEYSDAVFFETNITKNIITSSSNTYDINIEFKTINPVDPTTLFYSYEIKTFNIELWNNVTYPIGSIVEYDNLYYKAIQQTGIQDEPGISNLWELTTLNTVPFVQRFVDSKHELTTTSITVNELIDPYVYIIVYWHSGYATTYSYKRTFKVDVVTPDQIIY